MTNLKDFNFLKKIKEELRPSDLVLKEVDEFIEKINSLLQKNSIKARCVRGGSTAKGTFLKGDHDVDLFVIFDHKYKGKDISKTLLDTITTLKVEVVHGSRDYFHYYSNSLTYEIVPVLEVKDPKDVENVTDMSPKHVNWVNKKLNDKLRDDIRITKKFCKAQKVYGAESYISGFSGHVIDILIIHYGGFIKLLDAAKDWTPKVVIDVEKHLKNPIKELDKSKTFGPLIVVDPMQSDRNAAAAVSKEKIDLFINSTKIFLENPSKDFFEEIEFDINTIEKTHKTGVLDVLEIKPLEGKIDIVGAKLLKTFEFVKKQLSEFDFTILDSDWKWDKKKDAQMYFIVEEEQLSKTFVRTGPPINEKAASTNFKKKNSDVFEKNKILYANVERKYRKPKELIKDLIKDEYIKNKVDEIKLK